MGADGHIIFFEILDEFDTRGGQLIQEDIQVSLKYDSHEAVTALPCKYLIITHHGIDGLGIFDKHPVSDLHAVLIVDKAESCKIEINSCIGFHLRCLTHLVKLTYTGVFVEKTGLLLGGLKVSFLPSVLDILKMNGVYQNRQRSHILSMS